MLLNIVYILVGRYSINRTKLTYYTNIRYNITVHIPILDILYDFIKYTNAWNCLYDPLCNHKRISTFCELCSP